MKNHFFKLLLSQFLLCASISANAQWTDLGVFDQVINDLKTYDGNLWLGGHFVKLNGDTCYRWAFYDGNSFTRAMEMLGGVGIDQFAVFNGTLYSTGEMSVGIKAGVFTWDGASWTPDGDFHTSFQGIYADGNDLYAGSDFGKVYKKTGNGNYMELPAFGPNDAINTFVKYNGQIIAGGAFNVVGGTDFNNIAAWNGSEWVTVGGGLNGKVLCLAVYNNELYAGGIFNQAGGQNITYLARWNGINWSEVGGNANSAVRDMLVYDNKLYVVGDFTQIGNVTAKHIACWNNSAWTALNLDQTYLFPICIEVYNGKIYIGAYGNVDTHLFRFDGTVATAEPAINLKINCSPNPASNIINISTEQTDIENSLLVRIIDNTGRIILEDGDFRQFASYNCSGWEAGIYHISVINKKTQKVLAHSMVAKH